MNFMSSNTMNSLFNLWVIMLLHLLLSPCSSLSRSHSHIPPISSSRKVLLVEVEEKSRLGSTPPSCHNKCNTCHPCMAVQVPSLPSHEPVRPGVTRTDPVVVLDSGNKYFDYKPLGWKCRCHNRLFNP